MRTNIHIAGSLMGFGFSLFRAFTRKPETYDRGYVAEMGIGFWFDRKDEQVDEVALKAAIVETDAKFPWADECLPGDTFESIHHLSDAKIAKHNCSGPQKAFWFTVVPYRDLKRSQLYAYEKYANRIGEELSKLQLPGVVQIDVFTNIGKSKSFQP